MSGDAVLVVYFFPKNRKTTMDSKTVCIDIDGTLVHFEDWKGETHFGGVIDGASAATRMLHENGWYIIIYTTRANKKLIADYLNENKIEFDSINENPYQPDNAKGGKPIADVYVDDRALCFNGNWKQTVDDIFNFKPWEMKENETEPNQLSQQLLVNDFQQAFYMLRHYDDVNWNLTKFAFGQVLVSLGACWTIYYKSCELADNKILQDYSLVGMIVILLLSAAFTLMTILAICKNRSYFVRVSRYINEHRHLTFESNKGVFTNVSKMWENPNFPKVKDWGSTQMICLFLLCACYLLELILAGCLAFIDGICFCKLILVVLLFLLALIVCVKSIYKTLQEY